MEFPTFQDGMFPKCAHSLLCRAQIFGFGHHFAVDSDGGLCYDGCVGVDFSALFFVRPGQAGAQRNDPRHPSGVISFPWVRSLGNLAFCWIGRLLNWLESLPQHSGPSFPCAIGIYVKRKMGKASRQVYLPYLVSPFFVQLGYHFPEAFARRDFAQITSAIVV